MSAQALAITNPTRPFFTFPESTWDPRPCPIHLQFGHPVVHTVPVLSLWCRSATPTMRRAWHGNPYWLFCLLGVLLLASEVSGRSFRWLQEDDDLEQVEPAEPEEKQTCKHYHHGNASLSLCVLEAEEYESQVSLLVQNRHNDGPLIDAHRAFYPQPIPYYEPRLGPRITMATRKSPAWYLVLY